MKMLARAALLLPAFLACAIAAPAAAQLASSPYLRSGKEPVTCTLTGPGTCGPLTPIPSRPFNITLSGATAACSLERSFDAGGLWVPVTVFGSPVSWAATIGAAISESWSEAEVPVAYRVSCSNVSGSLTVRLSQ